MAVRVAERLITSCTRPYLLADGARVQVGVSVGIALYPDHDADPDVVVAHADAALYSSKQSRRGVWTPHPHVASSPAAAARRRGTGPTDPELLGVAGA